MPRVEHQTWPGRGELRLGLSDMRLCNDEEPNDWRFEAEAQRFDFRYVCVWLDVVAQSNTPQAVVDEIVSCFEAHDPPERKR